jgi:hypothetical protein
MKVTTYKSVAEKLVDELKTSDLSEQEKVPISVTAKAKDE